MTFDPQAGFDSHGFPALSHLGTEIAFRSFAGLERVRTDGTGRAVIPAPGHSCQKPAWSPVDALVACSAEDLVTQERGLLIVRSDGSDLRFPSRSVDQIDDPECSPLGTELVFTRIENGVRTLYRVNLDGTGERRIHAVPRDALNPTWVRSLVVP